LQKSCLYEQDGEPVGIQTRSHEICNSHILTPGGVAIHPDHAGKGYAKEMILDIIDLVKSMDFTRIELTVAISNLKAIRLYEKCGFSTEGILKNYTFLKSENKYVDEQVMALLLPDS
jgi:putative acetyltransferase